MKTQDRMDERATSPGPERPKGISRLATVAAILVVALIIGASVIVFAQLSQLHNRTQSPLPSSGKWVQVLKGYTITSVVAADGSPSTLYICATHSQVTKSAPVQSGTGSNSSYTILRSTDFGAHWQDVGSKANLGISCQIALNPNNSNELYVVGMPDNGQATSVFRHSTDGGQTWETLQPALNIPNSKATPAWNVLDLRMVGSALFGIQWLPPNPTVHPGPLPRVFGYSNRLVTSSDGGRNWTVLDQQFTTAQLSVSSYAVDPSNTSTIYELVSTPLLPVQPTVRGTEPANVLPYGTADLYKTTDSGANWQLLLQKLPFATQLHLSAGSPHLLYVGGSQRRIPYIPEGPAAGPVVNAAGAFHLQVSSDGGATWRNVPDLPAALAYIVSNWFVSSNGQVYVYPLSGVPGSSGGTIGPGRQATAVATPGQLPPVTPQTMSPAKTGNVSMMYQPALTPPPAALSSIEAYSPGSNAWSEVTRTPTYGTLLTVTAGDTHSDMLWFAGNDGGQASLYRYVAG